MISKTKEGAVFRRIHQASKDVVDSLRAHLEKRHPMRPDTMTGDGEEYLIRIPLASGKIRVMASLNVKILSDNEYNMQFSTEREN